MSNLQGHSYHQNDQLVELSNLLTKYQGEVINKVFNSQYNSDIGPNGSRIVKDNEHFVKLADIKKVKADVVEYNVRDNQLTGNDTKHEERMNSLESIYAGKVSKVQFDEIIKELNANDDSQDARLDALEQQFNDIQSRIVTEVIDKTNELVSKTDFNNMILELEAKDAGIGNKIIQLASKNSIDNAMTTYQGQVSNLQDKTDYNIEIDKLVDRNHSFEQRLMSVDQFFRVLAETYKLHKEDGEEIIYTGDINSDIIIDSDVVINNYKTIASGQFNSEINATITKYLYNTLSGPLKIFVNGIQVGSAVKSQFTENTRNGNIQLTSTVSSLKTSGFKITQYNSNSTQVIQEWTFSPSQVNSIPDVTPITIAPYNPNNFVFLAGANISITAPVTSGPVASFSIENAPSGLLINSSTGVITGSISGAGLYTIVIKAMGSNGQFASTSIGITIRSFYNLFPATFNGNGIEGAGYETTRLLFTSASAGSYSFFMKTSSYTLGEEWITNLYKVGTTSNLLTTASNISGGNLINGTISLNNSINNTTTTPNFTVTLDGNTQYYLEAVTLYNDTASDVPSGMDVGISIEKDNTPITNLVINNIDSTAPAISGDRSAISFTVPIKTTAVIKAYVSSTDVTVINTNIDVIPNTLTTYTFSTPLSPMIQYINAASPSNFAFTSNLNLPTGVLPTLTAAGNSSSLSLTFTPNIYPLTGRSALVQIFNGSSWSNTGASFSITHGTVITRTLTNVPSTTTRVRITLTGGTVIITQELNVSSFITPITRVFTTNATPDTYPNSSDALPLTRANIWYRFTFTTTSAGTYGIFTSKNNNFNEELLTGVYANGSSTNLLTNASLFNASFSTVNSINGVLPLNSHINTGTTPNITLNGLLANTTYDLITFTEFNDAGQDLALAVEYNGTDIPLTYVGASLSEIPGPVDITFTGNRPNLTFTFRPVNTWQNVYTQFSSDGINWDNVGSIISTVTPILNTVTVANIPGIYTHMRIGTGSTINTSPVTKSTVLPISVNEYRSLGESPYTITTNGTVNTIVRDPANGYIYIGGTFTLVNNVLCNNVARWNSSANNGNGTWEALMHNDNINNGVSSTVNTIAINSNSNVYVGGNFTTRGGTNAPANLYNFIAMWTPGATAGTGTWSSLMHSDGTNNGFNSQVQTIAISGSNVYVGGFFTTTYNGSLGSHNRIAMWTPSANAGIGTWSALMHSDNINNGLGGTVNAIAISGSNVYVGGTFTTRGGTGATNNQYRNIAIWTPGANAGAGTWSALGTGTNNGTNATVLAITISGPDVYVGGTFTSVITSSGSTLTASRIARWNGSSWSSLGTGTSNGVSNTVRTIAISGSDIILGGEFGTVGNAITANRIARWNGSSWSPIGSGVGNTVRRIIVVDSDIYIVGDFESAGSIACAGMVKLNNNNYSSIGHALTNGGVINSSITDSNGNLYIGGIFKFVNAVPCNNIARWNGSSWSPLGTGTSNGVNSTVTSIAIDSNSNVYVGGIFTAAGGSSTGSHNRIAMWNGSSWSALMHSNGTTNGVNSTVLAIDVYGSSVYVGGSFTTAGGVNGANYITRWSPGATTGTGIWEALGTGVSATVNAIRISGSDVYVGGAFISASGATVNYIARWNINNNNWSALGTGVNATVNAIAISGSDVYVGGTFTSASVVINGHKGIARWNINTSTWSALGTVTNNGVDGSVQTIAISGSNVYVGGSFTTASGETVNNIAAWIPNISSNTGIWSALRNQSENGFDSTVRAVTVNGKNIYTGGSFVSIQTVNNTTSRPAWRFTNIVLF